MLSEIREQPDTLRRFGEAEWETAGRIAVAAADAPFCMIAARGTSDHAASYAKYLFEIRCGMPVALAAPSVDTLYGASLRLERALVIGVSQSGQAPDVCEVVRKARSAGAVTVAITNDPASPLAAAAEYLIPIHAGPEEAVAATKTYTSTLAAFYILSSALAGNGAPADDLEAAANAVQLALGAEPEIARYAERFRFVEELIVLGRGTNYATAQETALKLIETSYVMAKSYSSADFLHGPIALLREGFPCVLFANQGPTLAAMLDQAGRLLERKAELMVISNSDELLGLATSPVPIPFELSDELAPIAHIVYGQLFAYHLALTRGVNPSRPRALSKITKTL